MQKSVFDLFWKAIDMKRVAFFSIPISLIFASSCTLLLIGATGSDTVGYLYKKNNSFSGVAILRNRNSGGIPHYSDKLRNKLESLNVLGRMELTNLNNVTIDVISRRFPLYERSEDIYDVFALNPGETKQVYQGVASRMGFSLKSDPKGLKLKMTVYGLNGHVKQNRLAVKSYWGVGP